MASDFAKKVIGMLTPSLGEFMATKKVDAACKLAGIDIEKVNPLQRSVLSKNLEAVCEPLGPRIAQSISKSVIDMPA